MKKNMELRQGIAKRSVVAIQKNYISESQCVVQVVRARVWRLLILLYVLLFYFVSFPTCLLLNISAYE